MMNIQVKTVVLLLSAPLFLQGAEKEGNKKNVLFIAIDDLRPTLGCYGDPVAVTPCFDRLAKKGFLFGKAYCQQAVSGPSRASLLTGRRPDQIGVTDLSTHFRTNNPDIVTLPQYFMNNGYTSIGLGKIYHGSPGTQDTLSWSEPPRYNLSIKKDEYILPENKHGGKATAVEVANMPDADFPDGKVTREAIRYLEKFGQSGESFFLAVGYIKPHLPFSMPEKYWNLYEGATFPESGFRLQPAMSPSIAFHNSEEVRGYSDMPDQDTFTTGQIHDLLRGYYACVSFMDSQLDLLVKKLEELGLAENTILVIWGDNGFHLGEQTLWGKSTNFEVACKVPFLIYDPALKGAGQSIGQVVELIDIYPTLVDLCGFTPQPDLAGKSLQPLMKGENTDKTYAFSQFPRPYNTIHSGKIQTHMGYTVRTDEWRYTCWYDVSSGRITDTELYYLPGDEIEQVNLSGIKKYWKIEEELKKQIELYKN